MKLAELAAHLGAILQGDPDAEITSAAGLEDAGPGQLTFVANPKYTPLARTTRATVVLVDPAFEQIAANTLRIANPYLAFAHALELLYQPPAYAPGIHSTAVIASTAHIGPNAHIGAYAVIGDYVVIGPNATILPHVVIYPHAHIGSHFFAHAHAIVREHCQLGDHVILQNGAIIGCDGFGFARQSSAEPTAASPQIPAVISPQIPAVISPNIPAVILSEARSAEPKDPRISSLPSDQPAVILSEARSAESKDPRISPLPPPQIPTEPTVISPHIPAVISPNIPAVILSEARSAEPKDPRISPLPPPQIPTEPTVISPHIPGVISPHIPAWHKILQTGPTILEDHVEIQANSTIDRASIGETRIRSGVKIDNLVHVGHGSTVGEDTLLCGQVGLAGSTHIGKNVILAGQVGVAGHCTIGDGAIATAQSGIPSDVAPGATVSGYPAMDNRKWLRSVAVFNRLPDLMRDLKNKNSRKSAPPEIDPAQTNK